MMSNLIKLTAIISSQLTVAIKHTWISTCSLKLLELKRIAKRSQLALSEQCDIWLAATEGNPSKEKHPHIIFTTAKAEALCCRNLQKADYRTLLPDVIYYQCYETVLFQCIKLPHVLWCSAVCMSRQLQHIWMYLPNYTASTHHFRYNVIHDNIEPSSRLPNNFRYLLKNILYF